MLIAAQPLRLILASGPESRREFAEWIVTAALDHPGIGLQQIHHTIRAAATIPGAELESAAFAMAHRFLDLEPGAGNAAVTIESPCWGDVHSNRLTGRCGGTEMRTARAEVWRDGRAAVSASIRDLALLSSGLTGSQTPNLHTWLIEWRYGKTAGISFRPASVAVRRLMLDACSERLQPDAIANLIVSEIEDIASVRVLLTSQPLEPSSEAPGVYVLADRLERQLANASR